MFKKLSPLAFLVVTVILIAMLTLMSIPAFTNAAPPAIPTPAVSGYSNDNTGTVVRFWADGTVITADGASTAYQMPQAEALDIQYVLDQGTSVNTTTFTLQHSLDNSNWTDGLVIVSANAADVTNLVQLNNFGLWTRVYANVETTDSLTITNFMGLSRR